MFIVPMTDEGNKIISAIGKTIEVECIDPTEEYKRFGIYIGDEEVISNVTEAITNNLMIALQVAIGKGEEIFYVRTWYDGHRWAFE